MNLIAAIAAVPAITTYRKAKADYEALVEKKSVMEASIRAYNQSKQLAALDGISDTSVDHMPGVLTTIILRFGVWAFGIHWFKPSAVFTNTSKTDYKILHVSTNNIEVLKKYLVIMTDKSGNKVLQESHDTAGGFILKAGDTIEIPFDGGYSNLINPETGASETQVLWDMIAEAEKAAGTKAVEIEGAVRADIQTVWVNGKTNKQSAYLKKPGVIFYGK